MSKRKSDTEFKKQVKEKYGNKIEVLTEYQDNLTKVLIRCNVCANEEYKTPTKLLNGQSCSKCSREKLSNERKKQLKNTKKI